MNESPHKPRLNSTYTVVEVYFETSSAYFPRYLMVYMSLTVLILFMYNYLVIHWEPTLTTLSRAALVGHQGQCDCKQAPPIFRAIEADREPLLLELPTSRLAVANSVPIYNQRGVLPQSVHPAKVSWIRYIHLCHFIR